MNTALELVTALQLPVQVDMFAKLRNLHISSFWKLCLRHQNIALSLEFHPLGAENWIHFRCRAPPCLPEVISSWILWFIPVPPTREIAPSDAFAVISSWLGTLLLPSLVSHVHGLISSLGTSPKHIWYSPWWPTFVTFLASFSCASYPESWQEFLHFRISSGQGRD